MSHDPRDDVDRLFACFKCGISPPQSALRDRSKRPKKCKRATGEREESSATAETATSHSQRREPNSSATASHSHRREHNPSDAAKLSASSIAIKLRSGKHISPVIFYGSPGGAPVKRPSQLLRLLHEIRVDLREEKDLVPRNDVWATFPRQDEAVRFARTHVKANIFSYQDHFSGQRRFLVSTHDGFWRRYGAMDSKLRHHYEVIQEGSPCHLYFDLEFNKKANSNRDANEMVDILISITFKALFEKYSIEGNDEWIIELDSSTEEKFSRHLIIRIPNTAFKDNSHVGAFVSEVCTRITNLKGSNPQIDKLYIRKDASSPDSSRQLFIDSAVYSRNRCFRLVLSSKAGKNSFLLPTGRFKCKNLNDQQVFLESLICKVDIGCDKLLICKMDLDCKKILCFDSEVHEQNFNIAPNMALNACRSDLPSTYLSGKSPFPAADSFVESIASNGNVPGRIRCWYWFSDYGLMVYSMLRNRYCERIGREHKSNHVMYIVDFRRAGYYQKCYDPDCKGYRSPFRPLPWDVIPDQITLFNSTQIENYNTTVDINFNPQLSKNDMEHHLSGDDKWITDSCKKESSWWLEALKYADCIENLRSGPGFSVLDEDVDEDCGWWMDADKIISQVEQQIGG